MKSGRFEPHAANSPRAVLNFLLCWPHLSDVFLRKFGSWPHLSDAFSACLAGAPDDGDLYGGDANYGDATADTYGQDSYGDLPGECLQAALAYTCGLALLLASGCHRLRLCVIAIGKEQHVLTLLPSCGPSIGRFG